MLVTFSCPQCGNSVQAHKTGLRRRTVTCPTCEETVQVPDDLPIGPGTTVGNGWEVQRKLGDSSLGEYYLASGNDRYVRIEILSGETSQDEEKIQRLMNEVDLMASMGHPNIVEAIEAGEDGGTYFLVTAYEPGETLDEVLRLKGALGEQLSLRIARQIAEGLAYAWTNKRVLHRDIKPDNIFITEDLVAKLTGFGIAKSSESQSLGLTGIGFTIGTPEYMSPEQIKAEQDLDFRSDIYGLGCLLYECLTGELPFQETAPILLMQKHMDEMPVPVNEKNPQVSRATSDLVMRMMAKAREERHETWQALIAAMASCEAGGGAAARSPAATTPLAIGAGADSRKMLYLGLGIGAAVIVFLIILAIVLVIAFGN